MDTHIKVTLVMYWSRTVRVCKLGRLHITCDMLYGLKSSVSQLPWLDHSATPF